MKMSVLKTEGTQGYREACHCSGKQGSKVSQFHTVRVVLRYWDVLSAARLGKVTRIGQSGDDTGFEEPKHMQ